MAEILKGAPVAGALNEKLAAQTEKLKAAGVTPTLAVVRVGENADDVAYERGIVTRCGKVGVAVRLLPLPANATQDAVVQTLQTLNADDAVHGVLLFRPLPKHMDDALVRNTLAPHKDVDGITDASLAGVFTGTTVGYPPCTAQACMEILDFYGIDAAGMRATVLGRSLTVGKPAAMMLLARNATVTVCHTRTVGLAETCRAAQLLIVSAGRAGVANEGFLSPGQVVIDVGINVDAAGNLCGDVDFDAAERIAAAVTPVPGGVGTVTTSVLAAHVVDAASQSAASKSSV